MRVGPVPLVAAGITVAGLWLMAAAPVAAGEKQNPPRPNIVLCMTDDQGWGDVSYNGLKTVKTPNLDAMAKAGLRFNRFYAAAPLCSPTRGSVLTGRNPNRYRVFNPGNPLRPEEMSIAQHLRALGYATGHFGKWHLNGVSGPGKMIAADDPLSPGRFGFDEWLSVSNYFDLDWTLSRKGTPEKFQGDGSDYIVGEALKFIRKAKEDQKPSLTVIWFGNPHSPHKALPADRDQAGGSAYYGEIVAIDRAMGQLREGLRQLGIADDTIIWFCSDNGATGPGSTGGLRGKKGSIWEGGVRVPGLIEWPARIKTPFISDVPACTSDIYPTLVDILQGQVKNQIEPLDGISLLSLVDCRMKERPRPIAFWHGGGGQLDKGHAALVDNRYKLHKIAPNQVLLYDLADDPAESKDLVAAQPAVVQRMRAELDAWQASVQKSLRGEDYRQPR
jgi:arylsulfatase A-like enzyme